ncbi:MAG: dephospho-CoA kinase [Deltaproteobacteria bacterium]|nr:dephospho-CoA kinase [Deltaproteobacteria bacterium]
MRDAFARFEREGRPAGLVEAALLMERPAPYGFDAIIVVICGAELQAARLHKRSGWSEPEIRGVLAAQLTDDERIARADYVLRNDGTPEDLNAAARALWKKLTV